MEPEPAKGELIEKILVKGNRKIEADAIRNKLASKEGAPYDDEVVRQDIQELFNLGYFYDVEVDRSEGAGKVTEAEMAAFLAPKVPRYKMPKRFFFWDALPKSGYGKIPKRLVRDELEARGLLDLNKQA